MLALLFQGIILYALSHLVWRFLRLKLIKTSLDNIPGPTSDSYFFGDFLQIFGIDAWDYHKQISEKYGGISKLKGAFGENILYVFDPKALHHIIIKDQNVFQLPTENLNLNGLQFGEGLLATIGEQHRRQRKMLNPVFSILHMREMVPTFWEVANKLRDVFTEKTRNGPEEIDVVHWMTRTALELVGQSGLGYSFDSLKEDAHPHRFALAAKSLVPALARLNFSRRYFLSTAIKIGSPWFRRFLINIVPWKNLHELRDIIDVMHETSTEIVEGKKRALQDGEEAVLRQVGRGKDIMSILLKANMEALEEDRLSESELVGQISTLIFAATDTTSGALSRILQLLAINPGVQDKLRNEILEAQREYGPDFAYDQLVSLPYLDAVCRETLRLYPPVPLISRAASEDIMLPFSTPVKGRDGHDMLNVLVPKNTNVIISVMSSNRNPALWGPDAEEWKPERWLSPLPDSLQTAHMPGVYSHLMTFLGGSRACIGFKFSQLEMKVVLATLLSSFKFSHSDKYVFWQMNGLATPVVGNKDARSTCLPIIVSRL